MRVVRFMSVPRGDQLLQSAEVYFLETKDMMRSSSVINKMNVLLIATP